MKPICALDVDGVVALENPDVPITRRTVSALGRWRRELLVPDGAAQTVRRLGELFDCVWIGAWTYNAHPALRLALGLPEVSWPFIPVQFHKVEAIRGYADGRPWLLIDDGIDDLGVVADPADGLLVRTDPRRGLAGVDPDVLAARIDQLRKDGAYGG